MTPPFSATTRPHVPISCASAPVAGKFLPLIRITLTPRFSSSLIFSTAAVSSLKFASVRVKSMSAAMIRVSGIEDPRSILQLQVKKERKGAVLDLGIRNNPRTQELLPMNNPQLKLVSFDLDGTILRGRILDYVKIPDALHRTIVGHDELFFQGKLGYEESLQIQLSLFAGMKIHDIAPDPTRLPLIEDLDATLQGLNRAGVRTVILTDNPSFAA